MSRSHPRLVNIEEVGVQTGTDELSSSALRGADQQSNQIRTLPSSPDHYADKMNSGSTMFRNERPAPAARTARSPAYMDKKNGGSTMLGNEPPAAPAARTVRSPAYVDKMNTGANTPYTSELYQQKPSGEEKSFMFHAKDLSITWADDTNYWNWKQVIEPPNPPVQVAELLDVCWLDVSGKFDTKNLSPGTYYVAFIVKLEDPAYGWDKKVNLELLLPNGGKVVGFVEMRMQKRYQWIEIPVGEFTTTPENMGEIKFSMYERESGGWKKGLIIKGAKISPKKPATAPGCTF